MDGFADGQMDGSDGGLACWRECGSASGKFCQWEGRSASLHIGRCVKRLADGRVCR